MTATYTLVFAFFVLRVYVLKELNRHEVKLLLCQSDSFFRHFSRVLLEGRPSALTPILGLFQVKNAINGDKRYYVALSNLRYREGGAPKGPIRVFDLKGLGRQRYIPETDSHAIHSGTNSSSNSGTGGGAAARRAGRQNRTAAAMLKEAAASTATPAANDAAAVSSDENYSPKILAATEEPFSSKDASFPAAGGYIALLSLSVLFFVCTKGSFIFFLISPQSGLSLLCLALA